MSAVISGTRDVRARPKCPGGGKYPTFAVRSPGCVLVVHTAPGWRRHGRQSLQGDSRRQARHLHVTDPTSVLSADSVKVSCELELN